ncbi:MAG: GDP-mannose 4,6-dehydratase [Candidatus Omnitrophica bacterium]|nr:GDP-mannose 4,6-dehydratase [Candidatus Omnitrophota bacterium]
MKKVLITGVAGMIGSHLADALLAKGYRVLGIDNLSVGKKANIAHNLGNPKFVFRKGDILNYAVLKRICAGQRFDSIVHLTASKKIGEGGDSIELLNNNVKGTENVLKLAELKTCKVVLGSTSDVYGMSADIPFREKGNLLLGPTTAKRWTYAVSKIYCEQLALGYYKERDVPIVILRYFGGFSPRASISWRGGHIPVFIDAVLKNREIIIHGDGKQTRSMAYISDIVEGTILGMENDKAVGNIFNIGNDEEMSVLDTAYLIHKLAGKKGKPKIKFVPLKKIFGDYREIKRRIPDLNKSYRILGYRPKVSFEKGLALTIKSRKEQLEKSWK